MRLGTKEEKKLGALSKKLTNLNLDKEEEVQQ
jgi:hypothetical protein